MCKLCDEAPRHEMIGCQDCGRLICFDVKHGDDVIRPAYVTASGDLFCDLCGSRYDREEEKMDEDEACYFPDPFEMDLLRTQNDKGIAAAWFVFWLLGVLTLAGWLLVVLAGVKYVWGMI